MSKRWVKRGVVVLCLSALSAWASELKQVALPVGTTTTLAMPSKVSKVRVDGPALVEVTKQGRRVTLVGVESGRTEVVVKTADGEQRFRVYVAKDRYAMPY